MDDAVAVATGVAITVAAYGLSLALRRHARSMITTPIFTTVALVVATLAVVRMPLATYRLSQPAITAFLGPCCVALGVTTYQHRAVLFANFRTIAIAIVAGMSATIASSLALARALHIAHAFVGVMAVKSVTAPVAVQFAPLLRLDPAFIVALVVATGAIGATVGPALLSACRVRDSLSRGVALGCISHGIGTAQAASESNLAGAASSLAMCAVAIALSIVGGPLLSIANR